MLDVRKKVADEGKKHAPTILAGKKFGSRRPKKETPEHTGESVPMCLQAGKPLRLRSGQAMGARTREVRSHQRIPFLARGDTHFVYAFGAVQRRIKATRPGNPMENTAMTFKAGRLFAVT